MNVKRENVLRLKIFDRQGLEILKGLYKNFKMTHTPSY